MKYSKELLLAEVRETSHFPLVWSFYGKHSPLSNFHACSFVDQLGNAFTSNEQYMMYRKAILFGDVAIAEQILQTPNDPLACKRLGRRVQRFNVRVWEQHKTQIMKAGLYFKFSQDEKLMNALLDTSDYVLAEASPTDTIWGTGVDMDQSRFVHRWKGENLLGMCLMEVRDVLREQN